MNEDNPNVTPPQTDTSTPATVDVQSDTYAAPVTQESTASSFDVTPAAPSAEPQPVVATPLVSPVTPGDVAPAAEPVTTPELVTPVAETHDSHKGLIIMIVAATAVAVVGVVAAMMML